MFLCEIIYVYPAIPPEAVILSSQKNAIVCCSKVNQNYKNIVLTRNKLSETV